jgi:hypothetical protein
MAHITTETQLRSNAGVAGAHTIAPGTYTMAGNITFSEDLTLTHDGTAGDVIIDLVDTYYCIVIDNSITISGIDDSHRIKFRNGVAHSFSIDSNTGSIPMVCAFNYCDFHDAAANNGLSILANAASTIDVTCNHCRAYSNANDGFSIMTTSTTSEAQTLNLNDCDSYSNGDAAADQGVTAHSAGQTVNMVRGSIHDNYDSGVCLIGDARINLTDVDIYSNGGEGVQVTDTVIVTVSGGSIYSNTLQGVKLENTTKAFISGTHIYGNVAAGVELINDTEADINGCTFNGNATGAAALASGEILITTTASVLIDGCKFYDIDSDQTGIQIATAKLVTVSNCWIRGIQSGTDQQHGIYRKASSGSVLRVTNTVFDSINRHSSHLSYGLYDLAEGAAEWLIVENCTFYNCNRGLKCVTAPWTIRKCVFNTWYTSGYAVVFGKAAGTTELYEDSMMCGHNVFWSPSSSYINYDTAAAAPDGDLRSTDQNANPQLVSPATGNFSPLNINVLNNLKNHKDEYVYVGGAAPKLGEFGGRVEMDRYGSMV